MMELKAIAPETILFGADPLQRVVAVEPSSGLTVWIRTQNDAVEVSELPYAPWLLSKSPDILSTPAKATSLSGAGFNTLWEFPNWAELATASANLSQSGQPTLHYKNPIKQALVRSGMTLFKNMAFQDILRLQVDIETTGLDWQSGTDKILLIAVSDNRGNAQVFTGTEWQMLRRFSDFVIELDPDVIEGHNLIMFDLPFIDARAKANGISLKLGRDGSSMKFGGLRKYSTPGNSREFRPVSIFGRHVIDTYFAVQRFDVAKGELTSYGLKEVSRALGISHDDRVELPREQMEAIFANDQELVIKYAKQDVIETCRLAELVCPTDFFQTQMVPDSYASCAITGTGEKINSILIRAYLHEDCAIPEPQFVNANLGGYTELSRTGVLSRVVKADMESLYPSIMLSHGIRPKSDHLNIFLPALRELTTRRLEAKQKSKTTTGTESSYWDGIQNSFKILINSFYGYLGATPFHFNDSEAAGTITRIGRELIVKTSERLTETGSQVIEIDTDGVYFVSPSGIVTEDQERTYVQAIGSTLPDGIRLAYDGRFQKMISLKTKNYVLQTYDGKVLLKGASLRSRADEKFGREFLESAINLLLNGQQDKVPELYRDLYDRIGSHKIPVDQLARRERITSKTFTSGAKQRSRQIMRNAVLGDSIFVYEKSDGTLGHRSDFVVGDENVGYYQEKLYKFACRLREAFGEEFDRLFPSPRSIESSKQQTTLDL